VTRGWGRRAGRLVAVGLAGGLTALLALSFVPPARGELGPGTVSVRAQCCFEGGTTLLVPPAGSVSAQTHHSSLSLEARIEQVDVDEVQALGTAEDPDEQLVDTIEHDLPGLLRRFVVRLVLVGLAVGVLVGVAVPGRTWATGLAGGVGGLVVVGLALGLVWRTYDEEAFREPTFHGPVAEAPRIVEAASRYVDDYGDVQDRIEVLGGQIGDLYATSVTEGLRPDPDETRILHVSDVHLNPVGVEVAEDLADRFDVAAVVDTGDLTTFGVPLEAEIGDEIDGFDVPYLFVPGNHDSPANREALAQVEGVTLLDGEVIGVGGVRILGVGDPTFTAENDLPQDEADEDRDAQAEEVADLVAELDPDVLAVHNVRQAEAALGDVPLVIAGHAHERSERDEAGTIVLTVGSTGATGLGSFTVEDDPRYEAEVLRFVDGELIGVDYVVLAGTEGEFTIDRTLVDDDGGDEGDEPVDEGEGEGGGEDGGS